MSYAPGAPAQVWAIPIDVVDAGAKLTLMALWSKADHEAQQNPEPTTVWFKAILDATPTMSLQLGLALMTGSKVRAIRQHLTKLRKLGLVSTCGRLVTLTPGCHVCHCGGAACHCDVNARASRHDAVTARPDAEASGADAETSAHLNPPVPPTPPSPAEVERATPTPGGLDAYGVAPRTAEENAMVYGDRSPDANTAHANREQSGVLDPPPNYPAHVQAHLARVTKTAQTPAEGKLPIDVFKAIEAHDNGAWSVSVASLTWADACADTMDGDNLDLPHVLRLLDAWTAEARPTRQPSQPSKKVIWYTYGDQGRRARAWVERAMESTRATLRVVGGPSDYELELEEMRR